ncbi:hypothetical protein [Sphingobium sp.]|uniref:hypothetical protein n=1 Tax=Sphingobium sp. TaxID=1912891 RepID=UPI002CCE3D0E|nr:hypothetical protein [Sphingobium sp.]HUD91534.1 hypothetical protein [Sphingobium sp.]
MIVAPSSATEIRPKARVPARHRADATLVDRLEIAVQLVSRWAGVAALVATVAAIAWAIL